MDDKEKYVSLKEFQVFKEKLAEIAEIDSKIHKSVHDKLVEYYHRLNRLEKTLKLISLDIQEAIPEKTN